MADIPEQSRWEYLRFVASLTPQERVLVVLKHELYEGSWDEMLQDLQARLEGKPYIFKLVNRIEDDIERICRMKEFEQQYDTDLCQYVTLEI
ncbi:MAG: hypothetical protein KAR11_00785 [Phycisphaerae bacterium]|nr:hypothetical protein [Phycisphaerae bacterium]